MIHLLRWEHDDSYVMVRTMYNHFPIDAERPLQRKSQITIHVMALTLSTVKVSLCVWCLYCSTWAPAICLTLTRVAMRLSRLIRTTQTTTLLLSPSHMVRTTHTTTLLLSSSYRVRPRARWWNKLSYELLPQHSLQPTTLSARWYSIWRLLLLFVHPPRLIPKL